MAAKERVAEHSVRIEYLPEVYKSGEIKAAADLKHGESTYDTTVYVSAGRLYRAEVGSRFGTTAGFIFDPKTMVELGARFSDSWVRLDEYNTEELTTAMVTGNWNELPFDGLEFRVPVSIALEMAIGVFDMKGNMYMLEKDVIGNAPKDWIFKNGEKLENIPDHGKAYRFVTEQTSSVGNVEEWETFFTNN